RQRQHPRHWQALASRIRSIGSRSSSDRDLSSRLRVCHLLQRLTREFLWENVARALFLVERYNNRSKRLLVIAVTLGRGGLRHHGDVYGLGWWRRRRRRAPSTPTRTSAPTGNHHR